MLQEVLSFTTVDENQVGFFIYIFCPWAQSTILSAPALAAVMVLVSSQRDAT